MIPQMHDFFMTPNGTKGVGTILLYKYTGIDSLMKMHADNSANLIKKIKKKFRRFIKN